MTKATSVGKFDFFIILFNKQITDGVFKKENKIYAVEKLNQGLQRSMCFPLQQANIKELQEQRIDRQWRSGLLCVRLLVQATKRKLKPYCIPGCPISMYILTRDALVHTATPYIKTYKAFLLASSGMQIIGTDTAKYYLVV